MAGLLDFAWPILGGLFGAASSGNTTTGATQSRDPWGPAQPHILRNLQNEADLQSYYQKTPFNAQQQQGYSNLFGDIGNFRDNVAPGLMDFANRGMTSNYQRQRGGAPGSGGGYGGDVVPGGIRQSGQGPFSVARGAQQNGLLDLNGAQNPYTNGAIKPAEQKAYEAMTTGALQGPSGQSGASGNGMAQRDFNPAWSAMSDVEKAQYYADNPTMAKVTQLLQLGFSLTDIAKLQKQLYPEFVAEQQQIAQGDVFGGGVPGYFGGGGDFSNTFAGMGPGDVSKLGVSLGQFGDSNTINSIAYGYDGGMFNGRNDPTGGGTSGGVGGIGIG